ncbi:hypothetical protein HKT18_04970 [Flavobacterium sp. IMCC34852]|uniref:Uncharacterized protein n=1 Tax=Flavobacterium rivulicola TaxID=2732161 RepID=A0A7Y3VYD1_9FLAO|nr:hypothetical protein [Flavobacterium sp. IMCC34852]NNT71565.1 hypothetical protein [Flavobacterium sp. IMCC34852]
MIDIRHIEMVTPDIERQSLIDTNHKLKNTTIVLFSVLVIIIAAGIINYNIQEQNKEK